MVINCDWLSLTQTFPSEPIYSIPARLFPCVRHNQSFLCIPVVLLSVHPRPEPLRAQGEQASGTQRPASRHLLGCAGNQVFGSVFHDRSPARSSSSTPTDRDRLLPSGRSGLRLLRLRLPGGRSRGYTANIFLHRLRSTTSSNTLCRLVWMEPPVPSALVPPRGTILNDCLSFSVCLL